MSMLKTSIWDEDNDDNDKLNDKFDDELNNKFDDEEDDFGFGYFFVISELQVTRTTKWVHQRLNWFAHVKKLEHENIFACTFRMSFQAFTALVDMLYQYIAYDYLKYGYTCTRQPVHAEITVAIGLQWLPCGSYLDLKNVY